MPTLFPRSSSRLRFVGEESLKRRHRTIFTEPQLNVLEQMFLRTHYPDVLVREEVAALIGLTEEKVEVGLLCIVFNEVISRLISLL